MKNIFSAKFYGETMRRMRMLGLILLAICVIITGIDIITHYSTWQEMKETIPQEVITYTPYETNASHFFMLYAFMFIGGYLLPAVAFGFLNKRAASDFYDSIPLTRGCRFITIAVACISWYALTILATAATSVLGCLITGMEFQYATLLNTLPLFFVGTVFVGAVTMVAMTITGTGFSNFIVAMLLLYLPRFILVLINICTVEFGRILTAESLGFLFDSAYSIPTGLMLTGLFGLQVSSMTVEQMFISKLPLLFTGVVALLYIALAYVLFTRRRSETAGVSAPGRFMQAVYRCAITLPILLFAVIYTLLYGITFNLTLMLVVLSLIVYFLYELITTKSFKRMFKAAPTYLIVVALTAAIAGGVYFSANAMRSVTLNADEVAAITVERNDDYYQGADGNYFELRVDNIEYTDREMINILTERLTATVDIIENGDHRLEQECSGSATYRFILNDGREVVRRVYHTPESRDAVNEVMCQTPEYADAFYALPEDGEITSLFASIDGTATQEQYNELWAIYKTEYAKLTFDQVIDIANGNYQAIGNFIIRGNYDAMSFHSSYPICTRLFPETMDMMVKIANSNTTEVEFLAAIDEFMAVYNEPLSDDEYAKEQEVSVHIFDDAVELLYASQFTDDGEVIYTEDGKEYYSTNLNTEYGVIKYLDMNTPELFRNAEFAEAFDSKNTVLVRFYTHQYGEHYYFEEYAAYLTLDDATMAALGEIIAQQIGG